MSPARSPVQRPSDRAWLYSRPFNVSAGKVDMRCLTFWCLFFKNYIYLNIELFLS